MDPKNSARPTQQEIDDLMKRQPQLSKQSFEQIPTLDCLSPHVISRQATINIGKLTDNVDFLKKFRYYWTCCSW